MILRSRRLLADGVPSPELVRSVLREHARACVRLSRLRAYYDGRHDVLLRERRSGLPNSRLPHGYPAYITDMAAGYLIGTPVRYEYDDDSALSPLLEALQECDSPSVDAELAQQQSIYGRGVELCYADENARPRCVAIDPRRAFVVYSDDEACARSLACICARSKMPRAAAYACTSRSTPRSPFSGIDASSFPPCAR